MEVKVNIPSLKFPVEYRFIYNISNQTYRLDGSNLSEAQEQEIRILSVPEIYESLKTPRPDPHKVDLNEYIGILKHTRISEIMNNDTSVGTDITYLEYMESLCRANRYNSWEIRAETLPGNENLIYFLIDFKSYSGEVQENQSILFYRDSGEFYNTTGEEGD